MIIVFYHQQQAAGQEHTVLMGFAGVLWNIRNNTKQIAFNVY